MWVRKSTSGFPVYRAASMFFIMLISAALNAFVDSEPRCAFWATAPEAEVAKAITTKSLAALFMVFSIDRGPAKAAPCSDGDSSRGRLNEIAAHWLKLLTREALSEV